MRVRMEAAQVVVRLEAARFRVLDPGAIPAPVLSPVLGLQRSMVDAAGPKKGRPGKYYFCAGSTGAAMPPFPGGIPASHVTSNTPVCSTQYRPRLVT